MKFKFFAIIGFILAVQFSYSQKPVDVFSSNRVIWFGLDYTNVKFAGSTDDFKDLDAIRTKHFKSWNDLIVNESKKYDIRAAFRKDEIDYSIEMINQMNSSVDNMRQKITSSCSNSLTKDDISKIVRNYKVDNNKKGLGLVFIADCFDKSAETASYWVTFFDIASEKVLLTEKMTGECGGFGFRNFWAKPVYKILQIIKDKEYEYWKAR